MAYGRKNYRRYRKGKRKMYKKGTLSRMVNAKIYKALDKNVETKFVDTIFDSGVGGIVSGTYIFTRLTSTSQGLNDAANRIGDTIKLKALQCRFNVVASDVTNRVRVTIIRWNEDDGFVSPTATQVYQNPLSTIQSYFNFDTMKMKKFDILYDRVVDVEDQDHKQIQHKIYLSLKGRRVQYNNASSTVGTGHIYFIYSSDSAAIPHPSIDVYSRVTYKDA